MPKRCSDDQLSAACYFILTFGTGTSLVGWRNPLRNTGLNAGYRHFKMTSIDLTAPLRAIAAEAFVQANYPIGDYTRRETAPPNVEHWYVIKTEGEIRQEIVYLDDLNDWLMSHSISKGKSDRETVYLDDWYLDRDIPFKIGYGPVTDTLVLSPHSPGLNSYNCLQNDALVAVYQRNR